MALVMVVDDSEAVRAQLKAALEAAGFQVAEAGDGNDGFSKITGSSGVSLIISDYNMPGMDGITMLTKVKEKMGKLPCPVFVLTTETSETLKANGKAVGVLAWITKPFVPTKLVEAVKKVTAKAS